MKRTAPVIIAISSGAVLALGFFMNQQFALLFGVTPEIIKQEILKWVTIIGGFTLILGVISILSVNLKAFQQKKKDHWYKLVTIISLLAMAIPGMFPGPETDVGKALYTYLPSWIGEYGSQNGIIVTWLFDNLDAPMMATMFATLAFYIASAAYRAFRARALEATLLLAAALIVMFWRVPMGEAVLNFISPDLPEWINTILMRGVNASVQRGIIIGAALGAASMSLRIILGIERIYLGKS
jgi:hypothetical protein